MSSLTAREGVFRASQVWASPNQLHAHSRSARLGGQAAHESIRLAISPRGDAFLPFSRRRSGFDVMALMKSVVVGSRFPLNQVLIAATLAMLPLAGHAATSTAANGRCGGIEYRLETTSDEPGAKEHAWWSGTPTRWLAGRAFLDASDFRSAKLRASPPLPGKWDIELTHTPGGARKYAATGNADRDRLFSIVVNGKIVQSYAFPPAQKTARADGSSAGAFPKEVAERLVQEIRAAISACAAK